MNKLERNTMIFAFVIVVLISLCFSWYLGSFLFGASVGAILLGAEIISISLHYLKSDNEKHRRYKNEFALAVWIGCLMIAVVLFVSAKS